SPCVMSNGSTVMLNVQVSASSETRSVSVICVVVAVAAVGVPKICPVAESMSRPAGKPDAANVYDVPPYGVSMNEYGAPTTPRGSGETFRNCSGVTWNVTALSNDAPSESVTRIDV